MTREARLFTVSVDSEDVQEGEWNDLLYIAADDETKAKELARTWVLNERMTREIGVVEAYPYRGRSKVLATYDPDEEHD